MSKTRSMQVLELGDPDFIDKFKKAVGWKPGETLQFFGPQFNRTDGRIVPLPSIDFGALPALSVETLKECGFQKWSEPDENGYVLWLYPAEWYDHIPNGTPIVDICGDRETFEKGKTDNDRRFGALAFGFLKKISS